MFVDVFLFRSFSVLVSEFAGYFRMAFSNWQGYFQKRGQTLPARTVETDPVILENLPNPCEPEPWFIKMVEDGLRRLPDFIALGQLPLVEYMGVKGDSHIARGKCVRQLLCTGIESLRPTGSRPVRAPSRDWYNYIILHDTYVTGIRNRDVIARLYISEGTFNRTRRNALRGVARWLIEKMNRLDEWK